MNEPVSGMQALFLLLAFAFLACSLREWTHAYRRLRLGGRLIPRERHAGRPWGLVDVLLAFAVLILSQGAIAAGIAEWYGLRAGTAVEEMSRTARAALLVGLSCANMLTLGVMLWWLWARYGTATRAFGFDLKKLAYDVRLGGVTFLCLAPVVYGIQAALGLFVEYKHPVIELLRESPDPLFFSISAFAAILVAPVVEEVLFRLLLQGWLERVLIGLQSATSRPGPELLWGGGETPPMRLRKQYLEYLPAVGSALLFALAHLSHGPAPVPLFVLALGLGLLFTRTQRITACIVLHLLLNASSLLLLLIFVYSGLN